MASTTSTNGKAEDFVTIVSVGSDTLKSIPQKELQHLQDPVPFVTVLSIGQQPMEEEVSVYRLPGEKLGFGLKFEGGVQSAECVRRLFIQSCAPESPAGRTRAAWGSLDAGDEILSIDRIPVTSLTRLQCVRCLKDSNVAVKLLVKHYPEGSKRLDLDSVQQDLDRSALLPPPVPPRKIHKKNGLNGKPLESPKVDHKLYENHTKQSPGRVRRQAPNINPPQEAQVYTDLFCHEKENGQNGVHVAESESDDTGSSISTVIDRLSSYSSFPGSVENSIPSTPTLGPRHMQVHNSKSFEEKFLAELPARMLEEFNSSKDRLNIVNVSSEVFRVNGDQPSIPPPVPQRTSVALEPKTMIEEPVLFNSSDANNNTNMIKINSKGLDQVDNVKMIQEVPKPLPRNLNKKNVDSLVNSNPVNRTYDDNLSPTKLQNIESWLQEAIDCTMIPPVDELDQVMKPEALPRLIDFVPKMPIYQDSVKMTEKPPVPAERKDYAMKLIVNMEKSHDHDLVGHDHDQDDSDYDDSPPLETIGEDDEDSPNCSALPIIKVTQQSPTTDPSPPSLPSEPPPKLPQLEIKPSETKSSVIYNEMRTSKVDFEEKRRKDDGPEETAVSRGPRSPPDGRENPITHCESTPPPPPPPIFTAPPLIKIQQDSYLLKKTTQMNFEEPPALPRTISYDAPFKSPPTKSYVGRGKDTKSEGSVKDKIAMFSSSQKGDRKISLPAKPLDTRPQQPQPQHRRLSAGYGEAMSKSYESLLDGYKPTKVEKVEKVNREWSVVEPIVSFEKKEPKAPLEIRSLAKNDSHRSTIDLLIEQRRQSMTKLRGLVIPDSPCISNLPEIKSRETMKVFTAPPVMDKTNVFDRYPKKATTPTTPSTPILPLWDSAHILNNVPKYSPAFKRKSLQVYGAKTNGLSAIKTSEDERKISTLPVNFRRQSAPTTPKYSTGIDTVDVANMKMLKSFAEDSDNDSAVSSTQSSYLSTVSSPTPSLNIVDNNFESDCSSQSTQIETDGLTRGLLGEVKRAVSRSLSSDTSTSVGSSNSSTLTSGSQASCSSAGSTNTNDSHRVLKPRSIEAINRKNILASAKCRSGKDNKFGSPLIERKFSSEDGSSQEGGAKKPYRNGNVIKYSVKGQSKEVSEPSVKVAYSTLVVEDGQIDGDYVEDGVDQVVVVSNGVHQSNGSSHNAKVNGSKMELEATTTTRTTTTTKSFEESSGEEEHEEECFEVRLTRVGGGGVGVTLAGGVDCEAKEVTIHKVLQGSPAERDGRLCKGDRVVSINGHRMRGVTHSQSVAILKDPRPEVSIVVRGKQPASNDVASNYSPVGGDSSAVISVELEKADAPGGAGLGISLEGGGNRPLLINKLFTGGAAFRSGKIVSGSELLAAGGTKLVGLTRTEAWGLLRALPAGPVTLVLRPP